MRRWAWLVAALAVATTAVGGGQETASRAAPAPTPVKGGTFRIALWVSPAGVDSIDPALTSSPYEQLILRATCAQLMRFPGPTPEVAAGYPKISRDRRTYTFTIKRGFRFNTGEPLTARNFAHALTRLLSPAMKAQFVTTVEDHILGGREFREGRAGTLRGVVARGQTLTLRLTKPWPELLHEIAAGGFFCPVPASLPIDPEGVGAPLPGSGPYFVSRFVPGREAVLVRNPHYRGPRPQHVDGFVVDLANTSMTAPQRVAEGRADLAIAISLTFEELARRYGVNRSQFFIHPGTEASPSLMILNSSRPLFRNNASLRRAVSFAVDRAALIPSPHAATPTDQFLNRAAAGFRDVRIYPLRGDIARARALARGRTRAGKGVLYVSEVNPVFRAHAALIQEKLRQIGLDVAIQTYPHAVYLRRVGTPGEPFDLAYPIAWVSGYPNHTTLNWLFHSRRIPPAEGGNFFHFRSRHFDRLLDRAERLTGAARLRAYADLDVKLARQAAPGLALRQPNNGVVVSLRAGCHRFDRPLYDLASLCLTRR